jgi:hypothetical protein
MQPTTFEKPVSATPAQQGASGIHIFTMPERFRHGAQNSNLHEPPKKPFQPPVQARPPVPPSPPSPGATPPKQSIQTVPVTKTTPIAQQQIKPVVQKKKFLTRVFLIVGGAALVVMLAVAGFLLVRTGDNKEQINKEVIKSEESVREEGGEVASEEVASTSEKETETQSEPFKTKPVPGTDTDSDGLTDIEEEKVYRTNPRLPDTDADGFLDGNEVFHRYNPLGNAPGTLLEAKIVNVRVIKTNNTETEFYYPSVWTVAQEGENLIVDTGTGEGLRVRVENILQGQNLEAVFRSQAQGAVGERGTTKNGLAFLSSEDHLITAIDLGEATSVALVIQYDTGSGAKIEYLQTLQMILNSLSVVPTSNVETDL